MIFYIQNGLNTPDYPREKQDMRLKTEGESIINGLPTVSVKEIDAVEDGGMKYLRWRIKYTFRQLGKIFSEIKKLF